MFVGTTLSLFGSGGSILAMPILVYFFGFPSDVAVLYSLCIVGVTSAFSLFFLKEKINYKVVALFGLPSLVGVYLMRRLFIPMFPSAIRIFDNTFTYDQVVLIIFAASMVVASVLLISGRKTEVSKVGEKKLVRLATSGLFVGLFTGLLGAGGGFLIVPALLYFAGVTMSTAVATSLTLVTINTTFGFISSVGQYQGVVWSFLFSFIVFSLFGMYFGSKLEQRVKSETLKKMFGWFIAGIGVLLLLKEFI